MNETTTKKYRNIQISKKLNGDVGTNVIAKKKKNERNKFSI